MSPALVLTVTAIAGAVGIWRITGSDDDRDRPDQPDTQTAAEQSGLITKGGPTP